MKNRLTTSILSLLMISALCCSPLFFSAQEAVADIGGERGNGGGGVVKNGRYMTFYTAGFYTEPTAAAEDIEIPGLTDVVSAINNFTQMTKASRASLVFNLIPSPERQYFKVKEDAFDKATRDRLLAEYGRVTNQPIGSLVIFAITDTSSKTTYLLPEFYLLKKKDLGAILVHEAYWIMHPHSDYNEVIAAEGSFQAALDHPNDSQRVYEMLSCFGEGSDLLLFAVKEDLRTGALKGLLHSDPVPSWLNSELAKEGRQCTYRDENDEASLGVPLINLKELFGADYFECEKTSDNCLSYLTPHLYDVKKKYSKSLFLRHLYDTASGGGVIFKPTEVGKYPYSKLDYSKIFLIFKVYVDLQNEYHMNVRHFKDELEFWTGDGVVDPRGVWCILTTRMILYFRIRDFQQNQFTEGLNLHDKSI